MTAQYRRRLININVNITVASVVAAIGGTAVIHFTRYIGVRDDDKTILMIIAAAADWLIDLVLAVGLHWMANHWPEKWKRSKTLIEKAEDVLESSPPPGLSVIKDATHGTQLPHLPLPHIPGLGHPKEPDKAKAVQQGLETEASAATVASNAGGTAPACGRKVGFVRDATTLQLQRLCLSPVFYGIAMGGQWLMLYWGCARELSVAVPFGIAILITRTLHTLWLFKADPQVLQEWEDWQRQRRARDAAEDAARAAAQRQ
ncbi:MAG: hypothetical protein QM783_15215 [Phycisphaerales bacterium]